MIYINKHRCIDITNMIIIKFYIYISTKLIVRFAIYYRYYSDGMVTSPFYLEEISDGMATPPLYLKGDSGWDGRHSFLSKGE